MANKLYTREEAVALLKRQQGKRTVDELAKDFGVSSVLIYTIYRGDAAPGEAVGFKRVVSSIRYERVPPRKPGAQGFKRIAPSVRYERVEAGSEE